MYNISNPAGFRLYATSPSMELKSLFPFIDSNWIPTPIIATAAIGSRVFLFVMAQKIDVWRSLN